MRFGESFTSFAYPKWWTVNRLGSLQKHREDLLASLFIPKFPPSYSDPAMEFVNVYERSAMSASLTKNNFGM